MFIIYDDAHANVACQTPLGLLIQHLLFILPHVGISSLSIPMVTLVGLGWEMKQSVRLWG